MRKKFYAIKWGETIRWSDKVSTQFEAARSCFGMVSTDMLFKELGSEGRFLHTAKGREFASASDGWSPVPKIPGVMS